MRSVPSRRRIDRRQDVLAEALEGRRLLSSGPALTPVQTAVADVTGVSGLLADPGRDNIVYVLDDRRVLAVDTTLGRSVAWVGLAATGRYFAISPDGDRLYVAEPNAFSIEALALPALTHVASYPLAVAPGSLAAGVNGQVYFATYGGQTQSLMQLDTASGAATARASLWGSSELRSSPDGTKIYRDQIEGGSGGGAVVSEYTVTGAAPVATNSYPVQYENSMDFEVDPSHNFVFTSNGGVYGIGVTRMDSKYQMTWSFDGSPYGVACALSPDQNTVYGASGDPYGGVIQAFDIATGNRVANYSTQPFAVQAGLLAATSNGRVLYVGTGGYSDPGQHLVLIGGSTLSVDDAVVPVASVTLTPGDGLVTADFDGSASYVVGSQGPVTSYAWDFGDGQQGTDATARHTYSSPGTYPATLTVTGLTGMTQTAAVPVTVGVHASATAPDSVLEKHPVTLSAPAASSDFGDIATYQWDTDYDGTDFAPDLTGPDVTFDAPATPQLRTIALRVTDVHGNSTVVTRTLTIVQPTVTASAGGGYSAPHGGTVQLSGTGSSNASGTLTYEWDTDYDWATFTPDLTGPAPTFVAPTDGGDYRTIALRVTDGEGNTALATTSLYLWTPTMEVQPGGPYSAVRGDHVLLAGSGFDNTGSGGRYDWDVDYDGVTFVPDFAGLNVNLDTAPLAPGEHTLALRLTNVLGRSVIATTTLDVASPAPPVVVPAPNLAPTAALSSTVAPAAGGTSPRFTVAFRDDHAIASDATGSGTVRVTGPNGYDRVATLLAGHRTAGDSSGLDVTYEAPAPPGGWDGTANGTYVLTLLAGTVADDAGATLAGGSLGSFVVSLPLPDAADLRVTLAGPTPARRLTAGDTFTMPVRLANVGTRGLPATTLTVKLFASTDAILDPSDLALGAVTRRVALPKGASQTWSIKAIAPNLPAGGDYFLFASVAPTSYLKERRADNNQARSAAQVHLASGPPDLSIQYGVYPAAYAPGQYMDTRFRLVNHGNSTARGIIPVKVYATTGTRPDPKRDLLVLATSFKIALAPGAGEDLPAFFPAPVSLSGRSVLFYVVVDGKKIGERNLTDDTATAQTRLTIT